jgi:hypothetical protein
LLAVAANPDVVVSDTVDMPAETLSIGVGADAPRASIYAGGARWTARTAGVAQRISPEPSSLLGVGMAVALAAGYVFRIALGLPAVLERSISLWTLAETDSATGPPSCGPVDVGSVWIVGAGAVGSGLAWWLHQIGVTGSWTIIDGDQVEPSNLNRSLGFFAADAGLTGVARVQKAAAVAALISGATAYAGWWDGWVRTDPPPPDVLLPLANDYGVRPAVAAYSHPAVLHATTSPNWTAELHRHLITRDGCIACRLPEAAPTFACATAPEISDQAGGRDAALPFLSASAGLLTLAGLLQLQHGQWAAHDRNHWRLWFDSTPVARSSHRHLCSGGCTAVAHPEIRAATHGGTRWRDLDVGLSDLAHRG